RQLEKRIDSLEKRVGFFEQKLKKEIEASLYFLPEVDTGWVPVKNVKKIKSIRPILPEPPPAIPVDSVKAVSDTNTIHGGKHTPGRIDSLQHTTADNLHTAASDHQQKNDSLKTATTNNQRKNDSLNTLKADSLRSIDRLRQALRDSMQQTIADR